MSFRKSVALIAGILTFIGVMVLFAIGIQTLWPNYEPSDNPFDRLIVLTVSTVLASFVYNLIKGEEPEESKEVKTYSNKEISRRLAQSRGEVVPEAAPDPEPVQEAKIHEKEKPQVEKSSAFSEKNFKYVEDSSKESVNEAESPAALNHAENIPEKHVIMEKTTEPVDIRKTSEPLPIYSEPPHDYEPLQASYNSFQTSSKPIYCPVCHKPNIREALYCAECGSRLTEYAPLLSRFLAFLIDIIILGVFSTGLFIVLALVIPNADTTNFDTFSVVWAVLTLIASFIYFALFHIEGQTLGKMALGIEVVTEYAQEKISVLQSFLRTILLVVDLMPYLIPGLLALVAMVASDRNQRIGDIASKTVVIKK
ncbi:RDD family protein [anaerobic digester metagenome]